MAPYSRILARRILWTGGLYRGVAEKLDMTELLSTYWDMALNHILG